MPTFIVTGSYTSSAVQGMLKKPSDRGAVARSIVEAAGGKLDAFYLTTGDSDFMIVVTIGDVTDLMAGLIATAGSGAVSGLKTVRAFSASEFTEMQKKAGGIAKAYTAPGS